MSYKQVKGIGGTGIRLGDWVSEKTRDMCNELKVITSSWNRSGLFQLKLEIHLQGLRSQWQKVAALW